MQTRSAQGWLCVLVVAVLGACGSDEGGGETLLAASKLIGAEGGTVELANGAKVDIPPGALSDKVTITVSEVDTKTLADLPSHMEAAGKPLAFKPHGQAFARPVKVSLPIDGSATEVRPLKLADEKDTSWETVFPSTIDTTASKLELETTGFSVYIPARPRRNSGVIVLPDGAIADSDAGTDAMVGTDAGSDAMTGTDAGIDAMVGTDAGTDATVFVDRCLTNNGGCDALVSCTDIGDPTVSCAACPSDYLGDGTTGCIPVLVGLFPSVGTLTPVLSTAATSYAISVDALQGSIALLPSVSAGATLSIEAQSHPSDTSWDSPTLQLGDNVFSIVAQHGAQSTTYTITVTQNPLRQTDYVKAADSDPGIYFGAAVAIDGDTMVVGATYSPSGLQSAATGAAYVFDHVDGVWSQTTMLTNPNGGDYDYFGSAVAIDGDTIVVGSSSEDSDGVGGSAVDSGAAFVFERVGGRWSQTAILKASNFDSFDNFGGSVSVSGDTIVVGATGESSSVALGPTDNTAGYAGAAYIFVRGSGNWAEQAMLKAGSADANDSFGGSVAIDGDTIVVGSDGEGSAATSINGDETDNTADYSGAAYIFVRSGSVWTQEAYLKADNAEPYDRFGRAVAVSGGTVIVSATGDDCGIPGIDVDGSDNSVEDSGAVYVFTATGVTWTQQAYLKSSNPDAPGYGEGGWDEFGYTLAIDGDVVIVGAWREDNPATGINPAPDVFSNTTEDDDSGAVYVYQRDSGSWSQSHYLKASTTDRYDYFGSSVDVSGTRLVCGAPDESSAAIGVNDISVSQADNSTPQRGAVYVFR